MGAPDHDTPGKTLTEPDGATQVASPGDATTLIDGRSRANASRPVGANGAVGRYRTRNVLGEGGMGQVVLVHDDQIGRDVALKSMRSEIAEQPRLRARFVREARVQGQLEHPSIVPVYDIGTRGDGTAFFTMKRVRGRTLEDILADVARGDSEARERFTLRKLLSAFATACLAVDFAHSRGVLHRDLKPSNIMLGDFGEVYVLDWGIAKVLAESDDVPVEDAGTMVGGAATAAGSVLGTPLYMAPEQMRGAPLDRTADVFALGAILFEIVALRPLRDGGAVLQPADARASIRVPDRDVPPEIEAACVRATATDPTERYATARGLHDAIERYLEGDREIAQRREVARAHGVRAREALDRAATGGSDSETERGRAMQELVRALALDPGDRSLLQMLVRVLSEPPRAAPPEVREGIERSDQAVIREGARLGVYTLLSWFAFVPLAYALGVIQPRLLVWAIVPMLAATLLNLFAARMPTMPRSVQYASFLLTCAGFVGASRLFGPLVLVPTMAATYAVTVQTHPFRSMRRAVVVLCCATILVPVAFEALGVLPASYVFEAGRLSIVPHVHAFPRVGTLAFLVTACVAMTIVPSMFVGRMRRALSEAEERLHVQAWHFRRLAGEFGTVRGVETTTRG